MLGAALAAGLYPKLITFDSSGGMKTIINQQRVAIVSSVHTITSDDLELN